MTSGRDGAVIGQIQRIFERGTASGLAEGRALERFVTLRDADAFAALVARHGPTVLGACRRYLRDPNDVDDAFQATFLILVRKADGLRDREALGAWLHGVACRVAARARADADRRGRRERPDGAAVDRAPAREPGAGGPELRWLLDEEIRRLPEKLRLPVVLCLLEGRTYEEAAGQLRWTAGAVRGRLAEARTRLRGRLARRGVAPAVALAWLAAEAPAVPPALAASALRAATAALAGTASVASAVALANRTVGGVLMGRIGAVAVILLALGAGAAGLRLLAPAAGDPSPPGDERTAPGPGEGQDRAPVKLAEAKPAKRRRGGDEAQVHRVTIEGRALDRDGRPVAGAAVFVTDANRSRPADVVLGRTVAGPDGRFALRYVPVRVLAPEPGPIPRPAEGKFEVAGSAPGLGFTWHAIQAYRPAPRPADSKEPRPGQVSYEGESIVAALTFGPPARLRGRVVDDRGRPVVGARVQVGYIDDVRRPGGGGMWNCAAISPNGGDDLAFNGVGSLPEALRSARTDADGRYSIGGLPREARLIALIDPDPTFEPLSLTIATTARAIPGVQSLGHDGVLDHVFLLPRSIGVRATLADTGQPAAGVTVLAEGERMHRAGAAGTTAADGRLALALTPGQFKLRVEPPPGMPYVLAEQALTVTAAPDEQPVDVAVKPGAVAVLEAVDAETGVGLPGARFDCLDGTSVDPREVQGQTVLIDHPATDAAGRLRAVLAPGRRQFLVGRSPAGYESVTKSSPMLDLDAGKTATFRFAFRKTRGPEIKAPEEDEEGRRLRGLWEAQRKLAGRGRMKARRYYQAGDAIPPDAFRRLLGSLESEKVPPLLDLIAKTFPDAEPGEWQLLEIAEDGGRRRQQSDRPEGVKPTDRNVFVDNGRETIYYNPGNAQVDIGDDGPKSGVRFGVAGLADFCSWPTRGGKVVGRAGGRITLERAAEGWVERIVADERTGFVYHESRVHTPSGQGRDRWQFAPRAAAGGMIVPGLDVEHVYQKDRTSVIWLRAIDSVDPDAAIPPGTFAVAIAPGTQVLDYREGRDDTYRGVVRREVTDVVAYADADPRRFKPFVSPIRVGQGAPAIEPAAWLDRSGRVATPALGGKVVLVDFWGIGCGPCVAELPAVREAAGHFADKGLVLVGLHDSSATPGEVAAFAAKRGLTWGPSPWTAPARASARRSTPTGSERYPPPPSSTARVGSPSSADSRRHWRRRRCCSRNDGGGPSRSPSAAPADRGVPYDRPARQRRCGPPFAASPGSGPPNSP